MMIIRQIVEAAKSAVFTCSVCQESIKDPVLLPCNHCFCAICLKNYICSSPVKNKKTYNCPNCSKGFTRRSSYPAPDVEGKLFQDLITLLEAETCVDLSEVLAKEVPLKKYDKQRYIKEQNEKIDPTKILKTNNVKTKQSINNSTHLNNSEKSTKPTIERAKARNRKRTLSGSKNDSTSKRKKNEIEDVEDKDFSSKSKVSTDNKNNDTKMSESSLKNKAINTYTNIKECDVQTLSENDSASNLKPYQIEDNRSKISTDTKNNDVEISESSLINKEIYTKTSIKECDILSEKLKSNQNQEIKNIDNVSSSTSMKSFHAWKDRKMQNLKTYKRKSKLEDNLTTSNIDEEDAVNSIEKVKKWLDELPSDILKRSKSLTPIKKSKSVLSKNKSLNEIVTKTTTEIARSLESEVLNDLLKLPAPKPNSSKDNWTRVKKEFRTPKFKKLDLSTVKPSNRKSSKNKNPSKQSDIIIIDDVSNDNKFKLNPRVVLENFEGFKLEEQVCTERNKVKFLSTHENLSNSLLKNSKSAVDLINQLTTHILNETVQFGSFFIFKECVNLSKKLREICDLKEIDITNKAKLFKKEIGINTESYDNICSKCHTSNLNKLIDLTQKIIPTNNNLQSTQQTNTINLNQEKNQSSLKGQLSSDIFIETENEKQDKALANDSNSESSLKCYTPKNISNTSKFMQDIIYDMNDMEFTQTIPSKEMAFDSKSKEEKATIEISPNILSNDDEDIIESTPKSNKSASRVKSSTDTVLPTKVFSQQILSQKRKPESESEVSEHPSIILGTEYTQKIPKQLKRKKRASSEHNENNLDVTLIEPIETQPVNSIPVLVNFPPPTEFMDTEEEDNEDKSKQNNLNNFSALPEATILKNMKTPAADINIQRLKDGPILADISESGPVTSIESVIEQTPLSCYPPKSRINLSNTKTFKQISRKVSTSDSELEDNPLEVIKDNTPKRLYNGPSSSKQISILSYVNASQERHRKLSESQISTKSESSEKKLSTPNQDRHGKLSESQVSTRSQSSNKKLSTSIRKNLPSLPVNMSLSQRRNDAINESFKSQFDTPTTQSFARPMASSTPARPGIKSTMYRLKSQRNIEIFWTRLSISQINLLMDFCKQFNIKFTTENADTTTHLITRVDENNFVEDYTLKYVCAVARGIWVLSFKWIEDCLDNNKILPEEPFEVLDTTGNPGPRMSRLRERPSVLLEKFAVCVVSSPSTFPKDKLINCILQNGGKIYDTVEELASAYQDEKIRLIITDTPETQDVITFQDYFERYGILSIVTEWLFNTIAIFKVESLVSYLVCTVTDVVPEEYPQELLIESEIMCDSTFDR